MSMMVQVFEETVFTIAVIRCPRLKIEKKNINPMSAPPE